MTTAGAARIAFVGAGNHATESLYPNIAHVPEFGLVAVCDLNAEKARSVARRFGAPRSFTNVEAMLDAARPQGVCVCGPPRMQHEVALKVIRRGIPVFVEKPPAPTLAQAEELAVAARRHNTWGMVGFMKRFAPANLVARQYMSNPAFGRLSSISLIHGCGPYQDLRQMLLFNGIHMLDLAYFLAGDVTSLVAFAYSDGSGTQAVSTTMQFAGGHVGHLNMNSAHHWTDCFEQTYVSGSNCALLIDASRSVEVMAQRFRFAEISDTQLFGWSSRYYVSGNMAGWAAGGHYTRGYWGELRQFARAILELNPPAPSFDDGVAAMRLIDCILTSIQTAAPVAVSASGPRGTTHQSYDSDTSSSRTIL